MTSTTLFVCLFFAGGSKQGSWWARHHHRWNEAADNLFYRLGYWVAKHTRLTLLISAMLVGACCIGFINFEIESDGECVYFSVGFEIDLYYRAQYPVIYIYIYIYLHFS